MASAKEEPRPYKPTILGVLRGALSEGVGGIWVGRPAELKLLIHSIFVYTKSATHCNKYFTQKLHITHIPLHLTRECYSIANISVAANQKL